MGNAKVFGFEHFRTLQNKWQGRILLFDKFFPLRFYFFSKSILSIQVISLLAATTTTSVFLRSFPPCNRCSLSDVALYLHAPGHAVTQSKCAVKPVPRIDVVTAPVSSRPPPLVSWLLAFLPAHQHIMRSPALQAPPPHSSCSILRVKSQMICQ